MFDNLLSGNLFFLLVALYFLVIAVLSLITIRDNIRNKRREGRNIEIRCNLLDFMVNGKILSKKDVRLFIKTYKSEDERSENNLLDFLEKFSILVIKNVDDESIRNRIRAIIDEMILEEKKVKPFEGIGAKERPYLMAIQELMPEEKKEEVTANLNQIVSIFKEQQANIDKNKTINRLALIISIFGAFLTVFVSYLMNPTISRDSIDAIKNEVVEIERKQTNEITYEIYRNRDSEHRFPDIKKKQ